ncbi:MAG: Crp/Fnr family transcriptional regulator [Sedimentisphaerales bacterium]|nr:Crp/Fnr family transcriptional regulator [Sedimentisphaerales bacterium]
MDDVQSVDRAAVIRFLGRLKPWEGLSVEHLRFLAGLVHVRRLEADEVLWRQGQRITHFIIVYYGFFRSVRLSVTGQEKLLNTLTPGHHFGLAEMITGSDSSTDIIAGQPAAVLMIDHKTLRDELLSNAEICYHLMQIMAKAIFNLTRQLEQAAFETVHTRLARLLLRKLAGRKAAGDRGNILSPVTHADLALQVGVSRETISRVLADFRRHHWIETGYRSIALSNPQGLLTLVEDYEQR